MRLCVSMLCVLVACAPDPGADDFDTGSDDTDTGAHDSGVDTSDTSDTSDTGVGDELVRGISGSITWNVDWDAAAESRGRSDCSYTRTYRGAEDRSVPWLCPDCEVILRADITLSAGRDCYAQISSGEPAPVEWVGWTGTTFRRANRQHYALTEQGAITWTGDRLRTQHSLDTTAGDDAFAFRIVGDLVLDEVRADPMAGFRPPDGYTCGWPRSDAPAFDGPWRIEVGQPVPDGWFLDACEESVRLHDFLGSWLLIDVSAFDCGPCRSMAAGEADFEARMAAAGVEVRMATLLAPTLGAVLDPTPTNVLESWRDALGVEGAVLGDRGWGYNLVFPATVDGAASYPTTVTVDPDGTVVDVHQGFGSWDHWETVVLGTGG